MISDIERIPFFLKKYKAHSPPSNDLFNLSLILAHPVPDPVPGLVHAEPRHLRQDEQAGEQEGHLPGHGHVPRQVSQG